MNLAPTEAQWTQQGDETASCLGESQLFDRFSCCLWFPLFLILRMEEGTRLEIKLDGFPRKNKTWSNWPNYLSNWYYQTINILLSFSRTHSTTVKVFLIRSNPSVAKHTNVSVTYWVLLYVVMVISNVVSIVVHLVWVGSGSEMKTPVKYWVRLNRSPILTFPPWHSNKLAGWCTYLSASIVKCYNLRQIYWIELN